MLRRELSWAGLVLLQIALLVSLTGLSGYLLRFAWFEGLFRIPGETVLLPAWIGIVSAGPLIVAILMVWAWQLARRRRGKPPRAGVFVHLTAAFVGAAALFQRLMWAEKHGGPTVSLGILIPTVMVTLVTFLLLYWPRLAFRSLRAPTSEPPR